METEHICRHCKIRVGEFCDAVVKDRKNGFYKYYTCNICNTKKAKKYRVKSKEIISRAVNKYESQNRDKVKAWRKVKSATTSNKISKPKSCQVCGKCARLDAHHNDYTKSLEVVWVCRKCHKKIHQS